VNGTYRTIFPGSNLPGQFPEDIDFMSYCANDSDAWISVRNCNSWGSTYPNGFIPACVTEGCAFADSKATPIGANQDTLRVSATIDASGMVTIQSVSAGDGKQTVTQFNPADQSNYNIVVRDSSGNVVSRTPVSPFASDRLGFLSAEVLATGGARVEVEHNGSVVATRDRSPHAPTITILSPPNGARLSGNSPTIVKWLAQDADRDPISVRVEYSTDDGKTFHMLTTGVTGNSVSLPASLLSRAREARIRVRANDGFNEGTAVSGRLSAEGTPPVVRILEPAPGSHFRNDVAVRLIGMAFSDAGKQLPPKAMKWYVGDRVLSEVSQLSVFLRQPGHWTIRLAVHDDNREASASTDVHVDAVAPAFLGLKVPPAVDHDVDKMKITIGSSIPGFVVIGDQGFPVETKPREIKIHIPKSKEDLVLRMVLVVEGKTSTFVTQVKRN
jgi:hypothetical protein